MIIWPVILWAAGAFITAPKFAVWDSNGDPLSGGKVYTYECGSTTPKTTYSNRALSSANANPVVLDSRGEADIYQSGCLKIVLKTSADVTVYTVDNFAGVGESFLQDADGDTIINVEESTDEDIIRFDIGGTEQVTIQDGSIAPTTTNDVDVGTNSLRMKKVHTNQISGHAFPGFLQRPKFTYVESLDYDGGTLDFTVGETVTGAGGGTGVIVAISTTSTTVSGTVYLNTRNAVAYVNDEVLTSAAGAAVANQISSKNAIVISPFVYYHCGTTEQLLYSDSNIPFEFANLGTSDWSYLYFDDSAIVTAATNLISASELVDSVTEPAAYNVTKHGRYFPTTTTNDMVFFAVLTDGSNNILEFFHDGGNFCHYATFIADRVMADLDNVWTDITLTIPSFTTRALNWFVLDAKADAQEVYLYWRTNGQTDATGHMTVSTKTGEDEVASIYSDVMTDSSQIIEVKCSATGDNQAAVYTDGWYFPQGL